MTRWLRLLVPFAMLIAMAPPAFSQSKGDTRLPPLDSGPIRITPVTPATVAPTPAPAPTGAASPPNATTALTDAERVAELKRKGNAAIDNRLHAEALAYYVEAYNISHEPALLYNQGRALAGMGQYPEALDVFADFQTKAPPELRAQVSGLEEFVRSLREKVAVVEIRTNVPKFEVRVKDERGERRVSSEGPIRLNAGDKTFFITAREHAEATRAISLVGGSTRFLDVKLTRLDHAMLSIKSETLGAIAFVDGQRLGNVPVDSEVTPGNHEVRLEKEGYEPGVTKILVAGGDSREVTIPLSKTGLLSKWWFWTAVGAVVIAGAGVTYHAATTTRDYDTGTICPPSPAPCRVSTALWKF